MRKLSRILLSCALVFALLFSAVPMSFAKAEKAPLQVGVVSDIHYFCEKFTGGYCDAFQYFAERNMNERGETPALLESALAALTEHAKENGMKYVLVPGDLTANGEYDNHVALAERLQQFEEDTGLEVFVIPGNHDINNFYGVTFESGKKEPADGTSPEQFLEIYEDFGYADAYHTFKPRHGKAGMLSYSAKLDGGYRLIALDTNKYSADVTNDGKDEKQTDGAITDELMEWALDEIADAKKNGEEVIGMGHHSIVEHFNLETTIFKAFVLDNWKERAEAFADAGLSFMLTGHLHDLSITDHVSDKGNVIYDISSPSITAYPNYFREILFDNTGDNFTADIKTYDVDCVLPVTVQGKTFDTPFRESFSFQKSYGKNGIASVLLNVLEPYIGDLFAAMKDNGSLLGALKAEYGLDLEPLLAQYIHVSLGPVDIFTEENVLAFLQDLDKQICSTLMKDTDTVNALIGGILDKLLSLQVSDLPCTSFIDTLGFGDPNKPGTLQDAAYSILAHLYGGNQDISDDAFLLDVIDFFENRHGANELYDLLYDLVVNDILQDTLLGTLNFNINTLFPSGTIGHYSMELFDQALSLVLGGDKSYTNVLNSILRLVPQLGSINGAVDHFAEMYIDQPELDAIGFTVAKMASDVLTDHGDGEDRTRLLSSSPKAIDTAADKYRTPTIVTATVGDDSEKSICVSWYTKFSVTGSDIEIVPYSDHPAFSGSARSGVTSTCERHDRSYPSVDLGIAGFMPTVEPMNRHTVTVDNLTPGTKYCYRVGDAKMGWWSEPGVFTTSGKETTTFLHITDPELQNTVHASALNDVLNSAYKLYPDTDLIVGSGNYVKNTGNLTQWNALGEVRALRKAVFMPAAGSHDSDLTENFVLPNLGDETLAYYDFDYNGIHFMMLDTNDATAKNGLSDAQIQWLTKSANGSNAQWKIVVLHKAPYSNGSHFADKDVVAMRKQFKKLFPELSIDMVLEGQDHVYMRTDALYNNFVTKADGKTVSVGNKEFPAKVNPYGTFYVISGSAGLSHGKKTENLRTMLSFPAAVASNDDALPVFSAVQVKGNLLTLEAYTVDENGSCACIDSFAIEKTADRKDMNPTQIKVGSLGTVEDLDSIPMVAAQANGIIEEDLIPHGTGTEIVLDGYTTDDPGSENTTESPNITVTDGNGNTVTVDSSGNAITVDTNGNTIAVDTNGNTVTVDADGKPITNPGGNSSGASVILNADGTVVQNTPSNQGGPTSGNAHDQDNNFVYSTYTGTGPIPLLGGETPVITMGVLFGAAMVAMLARSRKKEDEE